MKKYEHKTARQIFVDRDGMSKTEARKRVNKIRSTVRDMVNSGKGLPSIEDYLLTEHSLDADHAMDFLI